MEDMKSLLYRITDENVFTLSTKRLVDAKECCGIIKLALRKCSVNCESTEALFFGEKEWTENKPKKSKHYHIAFLRTMSEAEKSAILEAFQHFATKAGMGNKDIIGKWGVMYSINYLMQHALPFHRKF